VDLLRGKPRTAMIAGSAVVFNHATQIQTPLNARPAMVTLDLLLLGNPVSSPGQTLIRTSALKHLGGFRSCIWGVDDWDLWMRVTQLGAIEMFPRVALYYRCHVGNASRDVCRMLLNAHTVLARNLLLIPKPKRGLVKRDAYSSLYRNLGRPTLRALWQQTGRRRLFLVWSSIRCLAPFIWEAWQNSALARILAKDMIMGLRGGIFTSHSRTVPS
jgi:hypothetical protein